MRRALVAASAVLALTSTACGDDSGGSDDGAGADGGYDKDAYCGLLEDQQDVAAPATPKGQSRKELMKYFDESVDQALTDSEALLEAAPPDQQENWQELVDAQRQLAANGREFLLPANFEKFKAKSEDERAEQLFELLLGPYAEVDEKRLEALGEHVKDECGVDLLGE